MGWDSSVALDEIYVNLHNIRRHVKFYRVESVWNKKKTLDTLTRISEDMWHHFMDCVSCRFCETPVTSDSEDPLGRIIQWDCYNVNLDSEIDEEFETRNRFNVMDLLEMSHIISLCMGYNESILYLIYENCESIKMHTSQTEFKERFELLRRDVHKMMALCFDTFYEFIPHALSRGYVFHEITQLLYEGYSSYVDKQTDPVTEFLVSQHIHHDLTRALEPEWNGGCSLDTLAKWHHGLLTTENSEERMVLRLKIALEMAGRRYHHEYYHKKLLEMIQEQPYLKSHEEEIKNILSDCIKANENYEQESTKEYRRQSNSRSLSLYYGYHNG